MSGPGGRDGRRMRRGSCLATFDGDPTPFEEYAGLEPWPLGRVRLGLSLMVAAGGLVAFALTVGHHPSGWPLLGFAASLAAITAPVLVAAHHTHARMRRLKAAWPHRHNEGKAWMTDRARWNQPEQEGH